MSAKLKYHPTHPKSTFMELALYYFPIPIGGITGRSPPPPSWHDSVWNTVTENEDFSLMGDITAMAVLIMVATTETQYLCHTALMLLSMTHWSLVSKDVSKAASSNKNNGIALPWFPS